MARTSKGRQKVEITRMTNETNRLVTFSKRRSGLFKKASELSTLCGVDIAMIVFSPAKKIYSFGHPTLESVVDRYLARSNPAQNSNRTLQLVEAQRNATIHRLNLQLTETVSQLEAEKKRGEELDKMRKVGQETNWWEAPVGDLGLEELEKLKIALEELKNNVANQKVMMEAAASANETFFQASYGGGVGNVGSGANDGTGLGPSMMSHGNALGYGSGVGHVGPSSSSGVMDNSQLGLPVMPPHGYAQGSLSGAMDNNQLGLPVMPPHGYTQGSLSGAMDNNQLGLPVMPPHGYTQGYGSGVGHVGLSSSSDVMDNSQLGLPVMPLHGYAQGYGSGVGHVDPSSSSGVMDSQLGLPVMPSHVYAQGYGSGVGHVGPSSSSGVMDNSQLGLPMMPSHVYAQGYGSGVGHVGPSSSSGVMDDSQLGLPVMPPHGYTQGYGRGFF